MTRVLQRLRRADGGFTLTELLVVLVFLGMLSTAFSMLFSATIRHQSEIQEQSVTQGELRAAVDRMTSEIRMAYNGAGTAAIESISGTQIQFTVPDRQTPFHLIRVAYRVSGTNLQRAYEVSTDTDGSPWVWAVGGTPTNWATIAPNVTSAAPFSFYKVNPLFPGSSSVEYVTASTAAEVTKVDVSMTFATKIGGGRTYAYATSAAVRANP